jgi:hypothetical protein
MAATKAKRKPVEMEMVGGKGSRQRAWEQIRKHARGFTCSQIAHKAQAEEKTVYMYLQALEKGGYLTGHIEPGAAIGTKKTWSLVRDNGVEAPRLTRDGAPVKQGLGTEAMWRSMRIVGEFGYIDLAAHASTSGVEVKPETAKTYIVHLKQAGYLVVVVKAKGGAAVGASRYRLAPGMNTGPRPPMIQRTKSVYDPNLGKVVWQEEVDHDEL